MWFPISFKSRRATVLFPLHNETKTSGSSVKLHLILAMTSDLISSAVTHGCVLNAAHPASWLLAGVCLQSPTEGRC